MWALRALADGTVHPFIPGLVDWMFVQNTHGAYGLFGDHPGFLITISLVAFVTIFFSFRQRAEQSLPTALALGGVLGGALSNIYDRLHYHFVVDFIQLTPLPIFEVFNIADSAILIGIVAILIISFRGETPNDETSTL